VNILLRRFYVTCTLLTGCAATQIHYDAEKLRQKVLDFYAEEIMDNLIRASNGLFIVQLDLYDLTATVTTKLPVTVGGGQMITHQDNLSAAGLLASAVKTAARSFNLSTTPERDDVLLFDLKPTFTDEGHVYAGYLQFLNLPDGQNLRLEAGGSGKELILRSTYNSLKTRQAGESVNCIPGTLRRSGNAEYYIPAQYKQAYFDLCLKLVQRGGVPIAGSPKKASEFIYKSPLEKDLENTERKLNQLRTIPP
jgi:hypothetical protein